MRFKDYITEGINDKQDANKRLQLIKKDCQPYINILKKISFMYYLLSGRSSGYGSLDFDKKKVRQNRKPKDTPEEINQWVDKWFYKKFGIKARSQTLFCTSDKSSARNYGKIYYIFPIGNFEVIWSKKYTDLYNRAHMDTGLDRYKEFFLDYIADTYIKGKSIDALKSGNEIMLYCKEYYMLSASNPINHIVIDELESNNEI